MQHQGNLHPAACLHKFATHADITSCNMQPLEINALLSVLWFCDTKKAQGALPVLEGAVVLLVLATAPGV